MQEQQTLTFLFNLKKTTTNAFKLCKCQLLKMQPKKWRVAKSKQLQNFDNLQMKENFSHEHTQAFSPSARIFSPQ